MTATDKHRYRRLESGVHEFTLLERTPAAIDEVLMTLEGLYRGVPPGAGVLILWDFRLTGLPPIMYSARGVSELNRRYPNRPQLRMAYLCPPDQFTRLAQMVLGTLSSVNVFRFFGVEERDEALDWLLDGERDDLQAD